MLHLTTSHSYDEMNDLLTYLTNTTRYNAHIRPLYDQSDTLQVFVAQSIYSIQQFDIQTGEVNVLALFYVSWRDEYLQWNLEDYGNITMIPIQKEHIWKPRIVLARSFSNTDISLEDGDFSPAWLTHTGFVHMYPAGSFRTKCKVDTTFYPFDSHDCTYDFLLSEHRIEEVNFIVPNGDSITDNFEENAEWTVEANKCEAFAVSSPSFSVPGIRSTMTLKRRPLFEMVTYSTPLVLLEVLMSVSCLIPPTCGERLTYVVTINLAFVFLILATIARTPVNSLKLPMLCYMTMIAHMVNTLSILYNIYILYLAAAPNKDIWAFTFLRKLALKHKLAKSKRTETNAFKRNDVRPIAIDGNADENGDKNDYIEHNEEKMRDSDIYQLEGTDIATVCDVYFFRACIAYNVLLFGINAIVYVIVYSVR
ncbi:hypothetical protein ACF0H5_008407 [Mactra antiquata]